MLDDVGEGTPASFLKLPTYSADNLSDPTGSTFFTGRIVSMPFPMSAALNTVPEPSTDDLAAYDARRVLRIDPVYAGGAPASESRYISEPNIPDGTKFEDTRWCVIFLRDILAKLCGFF